MNFAIRDDDVSYFTRPEDLENIYENIWVKCPVSLSVIPLQASTKNKVIPQKYWATDKTFPIGENKQLVEFLKEKIKEKKISIMLHGYSHKDYENGHEFETGYDLEGKAREGKKYLEKIFDIEIKTFVPPHNALSKKGLQAVIKNKMNIVAPIQLQMNPTGIKNFIRAKAFRALSGQLYPYIIDFGNYRQLLFHSLTPGILFERLKKDFDFVRKKNGNFVLATHHWEFNLKQGRKSQGMITVFNNLWKHIQQFKDIEFCTVDEMFLK